MAAPTSTGIAGPSVTGSGVTGPGVSGGGGIIGQNILVTASGVPIVTGSGSTIKT